VDPSKSTIDLWRKEAREALRIAELAHNDGIYWASLFNCHHAVEKALKAQYMEDKSENPPTTHALLDIAHELSRTWEDGDVTLFDTLTDFAVDTRYHDETWLGKMATREHSEYWIERTNSFLSALLP